MRTIPVTVSFDALDTLIQITNGIGFQYRTAYSSFLQNHGIDLAATCPNATNDKITELALKAIHDQAREDRAKWTRSSNPKEMPLGGDTDEELDRFWSSVLTRTFRHPALYEGASTTIVHQIDNLWDANPQATRDFLYYVDFDLFASSRAYSWHPEALRTLESLREWNQKRQHRLQVERNSASSAPLLVLEAPPFVVSNMDPLLRIVFTQLGAFKEGPHGEPPLLSRVIVARDVGFAKPSPAGIITGVRDIVAAAGRHTTANAEKDVDKEALAAHLRWHVHVGDAEADRLACERAGCTYVECSPVTGATWELLRAKLEELEASAAN